MWCDTLNATVSGVSTDALLFSQSGMPLVHRYHVFGRGGTHVSLCGSFMSRLRAFTMQADADRPLARKWDAERSSSLREDSDLQCVMCHRTWEDVSARCRSRRARSPRTKTISTTTTSYVAVSTLGPRFCLCRGRPPLLPIDLRLPSFADKDFIPSRL